jgi:prevent-host-death family protein
MRTVSALDVRAKFGQILDEAAAGERFVVERAGVPVAAIVPLADLADADPDVVRERRLAAVEQLRQFGDRYRKLYGPVDAAAIIRYERDHGHSV